MKKSVDFLKNMKRIHCPKIYIGDHNRKNRKIKNKILNQASQYRYFFQRGLIIGLFVLAIGFGANYLVHSSSGVTIIGEDIFTNNLTASGMIKEGGTALSQKYISIPENPAKGDMFYYDGDGWAKLNPGTSGYYLKTQGANNNPVWATINYTETDPLSVHEEIDPLSVHKPASPAQGDIIYYNGTNWTKLIAGTNGYFLKTQGISANPLWAEVSFTETDPLSIHIPGSSVQGDILYHNGTTWTRLVAGNSGEFLKTQGVNADPVWAEAGGKTTATLVVAAFNSKNISRADYVCDGTEDQTEINNAINALTTTITDESFATGASLDVWISLNNNRIQSGEAVTNNGTTYVKGADYEIDYSAGKIKPLNTGSMAVSTTYYIDYDHGGGTIALLEGTYIIDGSIFVKSHTVLTGSGGGTVIKIKDGLAFAFRMIENSDTTNGNSNIIISHLKLDGNGNSYGIYFTKVGFDVGETSQAGSIIENVFSRDFVNSNIIFSSSLYNLIKANSLQNGVDSIALTMSSNYNTITGNTFEDNGDSIAISDSKYNTVTGNTFKGNNECVYIVGPGASYNTISGNTCVKSEKNGMRVNLFASNNLISNNSFYDNGKETASAWDGIHINLGSNYNTIENNMIRRGTGNTHRYGIRVNMANCDGNLVINNDLYNAGGTANFSDAGVNTIIRDNRGYNSVGVVSTPFDNINHQIKLSGSAAGPTVASQDYEVLNTPCKVISTGGTGVDIIIKDAAGTIISNPGATCDEWLEIGWKINFGGFSAAPTVTTVFK